MNYEEIKRKHNLTDEKIGKIFGYKNKMSFSNATRKAQITKGIEELYRIFTAIHFIDNPVVNKISAERSQEIEVLLMPKLTEAFEELKKTNPLFSKKSAKE